MLDVLSSNNSITEIYITECNIPVVIVTIL